jgi:hypothetical protein
MVDQPDECTFATSARKGEAPTMEDPIEQQEQQQQQQPEQPEQRGQPATVPKVLWLASTALAGMRGPPPHFVGPLHLCAWLRASEPIFSKTHTNEFCGIEKSTPEPAGPCAPLRPGRWVYEKGSRKPCGGDVERLSASAPLRGSLRRPLTVPFRSSPPSRGALRSAGVPTIAASTTPAPLLPWRISARGQRGIWEDSVQAQGNTPYAPRGGLCGCLAVRHTCSKPPGVPTGWGRLRAEPPGRASSWGV